MYKRKRRVMPIGFQIYNLKRLFNKANPHLDLSSLEDEVIDLDLLDNTLSYGENLELLKKEYPQFLWELEKKEFLGNKPIWKREIKDSCIIHKTTIPIKEHRTSAEKKGYVRGRIQVTVDKQWIGKKATIIVRIPREEKRKN